MAEKKYTLKSQAIGNAKADFQVDYSKELNAEQLRVVKEADGPCLVLAGAGSGKTRTLVYRVLYLLERGVKPENILLVTFTNKAAKEMLERIEVYLGAKANGLWGGTFHHIGNRLLRRYGSAIGIDSNFTILDGEDALTLIKSSLAAAHPPADKYFPKARVISAIISLSTNLAVSVEEICHSRFSHLKEEYLPIIKSASEFYRQRKTQANLLDFDDLLWQWNQLLINVPAVRQKLGQKFSYILVDEYQDTNYLQNQIIVNLAEPQKNVLVVGDDAQSIYSFRGADVNNILNFPKIFTAVKIFRLETNYRSTPEILNLANYSIDQNKYKFPKELKTNKPSASKPAVASLTDLRQQADFVCQRILDLQREENISLSNVAVLFRSHFQSLELEMELNKRNIPYQMRGGLRFFEQAHLKDVLAYLKILFNLKDEVSWLRILGLQTGIGEATADKIWREVMRSESLSTAVKINFNLSAKAQSSWENLKKVLDRLAGTDIGDLSSMISLVLSGGYEDYLKSVYENYSERLEDLEQLKDFVSNYDSLEKFLADTALSENFRGERKADYGEGDNDNEVIVLSTIHQAKGLEWKIVFVIGLVDGQFPHAKVWEHPEELEEERRLFYVATTRAQDQLYLTYPLFTRDDAISHPSQFIKELPDKLYDRWDVEEEIVYVSEDEEVSNTQPNRRRKLLDFEL